MPQGPRPTSYGSVFGRFLVSMESIVRPMTEIVTKILELKQLPNDVLQSYWNALWLRVMFDFGFPIFDFWISFSKIRFQFFEFKIWYQFPISTFRFPNSDFRVFDFQISNYYLQCLIFRMLSFQSPMFDFKFGSKNMFFETFLAIAVFSWQRQCFLRNFKLFLAIARIS